MKKPQKRFTDEQVRQIKAALRQPETLDRLKTLDANTDLLKKEYLDKKESFWQRLKNKFKRKKNNV